MGSLKLLCFTISQLPSMFFPRMLFALQSLLKDKREMVLFFNLGGNYRLEELMFLLFTL